MHLIDLEMKKLLNKLKFYVHYARETRFQPWSIYVAVSRVASKNGLKLLPFDKEHGVRTNKTNVVYQAKVFKNI